MGFFKDVFTYCNSYNVTMTITKSGDKLSVAFMPIKKSDGEAYSELQPLILTGTPEELDENLITEIVKPALQKADNAINNIEVFEKGLKQAEEAKTKKKEVSKKKEQTKTETKDLFAQPEETKSIDEEEYEDEENEEIEEVPQPETKPIQQDLTLDLI